MTMEMETLAEDMPEAEEEHDDDFVEQQLRLDLSQLSLKGSGPDMSSIDDMCAPWQRNKNAARRRGIRAETHPQRQSTPRRRLFEARMADQVFSSSGGAAAAATAMGTGNNFEAAASQPQKMQEEVALALTPRLARSSSHMGFALSSRTSRGSLDSRDNAYRYMKSRSLGRDHRETRSARTLPRETLECIAATAREVAAESLFTGTRNVAAAFGLCASQSAMDLPTYLSSPLGKMDSVREDADEALSVGESEEDAVEEPFAYSGFHDGQQAQNMFQST